MVFAFNIRSGKTVLYMSAVDASRALGIGLSTVRESVHASIEVRGYILSGGEIVRGKRRGSVNNIAKHNDGIANNGLNGVNLGDKQVDVNKFLSKVGVLMDKVFTFGRQNNR